MCISPKIPARRAQIICFGLHFERLFWWRWIFPPFKESHPPRLPLFNPICVGREIMEGVRQGWDLFVFERTVWLTFISKAAITPAPI